MEESCGVVASFGDALVFVPPDFPFALFSLFQPKKLWRWVVRVSLPHKLHPWQTPAALLITHKPITPTLSSCHAHWWWCRLNSMTFLHDVLLCVLTTIIRHMVADTRDRAFSVLGQEMAHLAKGHLLGPITIQCLMHSKGIPLPAGFSGCLFYCYTLTIPFLYWLCFEL